MCRKAVIVGADGQDGCLLNELLSGFGYEILCITRNRVYGTCQEKREINCVISDRTEVFRIVDSYKPDEIYYLAAVHESSEEQASAFHEYFSVNVLSLNNFLEAIRAASPQTKLFYAASSHVFGIPESECQDETTPISPVCIYGITKAAGLLLCRLYRKNYSIFASVGIMYNHESQYRNEKFISKKVVKAAVNIKSGMQEKLVLGDLKCEIDWGYAPDYVIAMHKIMNLPQADDFIIATGKKHSVLDLVKAAFQELELDWKQYLVEDGGILKKKNIVRIGDPRKLKMYTGWEPSIGFQEMIGLLVKDEVGKAAYER